MEKKSRARRLAKRALPTRLLARRRREYQADLAMKGAPLRDIRRILRAAQRAAAATNQQLADTYSQVTADPADLEVAKQGENDG